MFASYSSRRASVEFLDQTASEKILTVAVYIQSLVLVIVENIYLFVVYWIFHTYFDFVKNLLSILVYRWHFLMKHCLQEKKKIINNVYGYIPAIMLWNETWKKKPYLCHWRIQQINCHSHLCICFRFQRNNDAHKHQQCFQLHHNNADKNANL